MSDRPTDPAVNPYWVADFTPTLPDLDGPSVALDVPTAGPVNEGPFPSVVGWRVASVTSRRVRPRWWWPFGGRAEWVTTVHLVPAEDDR